MLKILVLAALPQEYAHFRRITPRWLLLCARPYKKYSHFLADREIVLIETGMGKNFAVDAFWSALAGARPDLVVFAGFAGGLHAGLAVGRVCVVRETMLLDAAANPGDQAFTFRFSHELSEFLAAKQIRPVTAVTVSAPPDKRALSPLAAEGPAVIDMETARVAEFASRLRLPFLSFRAVSDALDDELGFDLGDITGKRGKVDILKVLMTIIRNPPAVRAFYRSWRRSALAGKNLGLILADFLNLPADTLLSIAGESPIERTERAG
ncbi:MAG: hypothetical protein WAW37_03700 [Syntrophobacteraceae bacterium]